MAKTPGWDAFYEALEAKYWDALSEESRALLDDADLPDDVRRAACMIHPHPVGWLDNPIPNLDGRTARQVLGRRGGPDKIRAILMEIAPAFLPDFQEKS